jgi:hypothetical protein
MKLGLGYKASTLRDILYNTSVEEIVAKPAGSSARRSVTAPQCVNETLVAEQEGKGIQWW